MRKKPGAAMGTEVNYRSLAELRYAIRRFQRFSEAAAIGAGIPPQQHQALLAIKGFGGPDGLTVGELAEWLLIRHNTAAELVNRLEMANLARRESDETDGRRANIRLTSAGERALAKLSAIHQEELLTIGRALLGSLKTVSGTESS